MRSAFSMIELIFVIVILGVLAAVAIPKLSATRDDAKLARTSHAIATASTEIAGYAISKGTIETAAGEYDMSVMSNMISGLIGAGEAMQSSINVPRTDFKMGSIDDCISLEINDGILDANLTLKYGAGGFDPLCSKLQSMFDASEYPIPLKGSRIVQ